MTLFGVLQIEALEVAPQSRGHAPLSPDYVPGPEHPPSPDYVPGLEYPKYLVPSNDEDEASEEDGEEEEHLAPADSTTLHAIDPIPSAEDTEVFATDESASTPPSPPTHIIPTYADAPLGYRATMIRSRAASPPFAPSPRLHMARISVRPQKPMAAATEALIDVIPSPPLPLPSPPLLLPAPSSPLLLPATDHRKDVPEADVSPQKRLCLTAPAPSFVDTVDATLGRPMSREVSYEITDVWCGKLKGDE
nr:hypothetical protein [Tanacetum cinerariifolium]